MPKFYGYIRVSSYAQVQSGLSLDAQYDSLKRYYDFIQKANPDLEWGGVITDDGESAYKKKLMERPGGRKLIGKISGGDHVAFARLDRGFRNLRDLVATLELWKLLGIKAHFLDIGIDTSTAVGELMLNVIGAIAQFESKLKSERIRAALAAKYRGKVPKNLVPGKANWKMKPKEMVGKKNIAKAQSNSRSVRERLVVGRYCMIRRKQGWSWTQLAERIHEIFCAREGVYKPNYDWHRRYKLTTLQNRTYMLAKEAFPEGVGGWGIRVKDAGYGE